MTAQLRPPPFQVHLLPPGVAVTVYPVISESPMSSGANHETTTWPSAARPVTEVGWPGAPGLGAATNFVTTVLLVAVLSSLVAVATFEIETWYPIATSSSHQPWLVTDESDASRNRTRAEFPAKVERSASTDAYFDWLPLKAERPPIGLL